MKLSPIIHRKLTALTKHQLIRQLTPIQNRHENFTQIKKQSFINFCNNDYLGLSCAEKIKKALIKALEGCPVGSGSAVQVSGYYEVQAELEKQFASYLNRESAIFFNSGYLANLGVLTTFANRSNNILADKQCHASILDGAKLSRANFIRYQHNDFNALACLMDRYQNKHDIIITESVFSMEGRITPIDNIVALNQKINRLLIIDDAHGFGVLGKTGRGVSEYFSLGEKALPIIITPLGKAMGIIGAMVSGPKKMTETILQLARTHRYTTALPPIIIYALLQALEILKKETWRIEKLNSLIHCFNEEAQVRELPLVSSDQTAIKSFLIADNEKALALQRKLSNHGFLVACIRPPTVPQGTARIKISLNCLHDEIQIKNLLDCFVKNHEYYKKQ